MVMVLAGFYLTQGIYLILASRRTYKFFNVKILVTLGKMTHLFFHLFLLIMMHVSIKQII